MMEGFQEDIRFVECYEREMEARCESGVWWEGWMIVGELMG